MGNRKARQMTTAEKAQVEQTDIHVLYHEEGPASGEIYLQTTTSDGKQHPFYLTATEARELGVSLIVASDRMSPSSAADIAEDEIGIHRSVGALTPRIMEGDSR